MSMIQPWRSRAGTDPHDLVRNRSERAGDQDLVRRAEIGAPEDLQALRRDLREGLLAVQHDDDAVRRLRQPSASLRPVVISTGSPMRLSGMRWRAASAWTLLMPGMTSQSSARPPARTRSTMRRVLS